MQRFFPENDSLLFLLIVFGIENFPLCAYKSYYISSFGLLKVEESNNDASEVSDKENLSSIKFLFALSID